MMTRNRSVCDSNIGSKDVLISEHESCVIDGFVFFSFGTADDQLTFSRLPASELRKVPVLIHPVAPNIAGTKDALFNDCGTSDLTGITHKTHRERKTCSFCGEKFAFEFSLEFHLRYLIPKHSKKLYCEFCPHISLSGETMRMHNQHHHGKKIFDHYKGEDFLKELCGGTVPACKPLLWSSSSMGSSL